ncbi:oxygen-independent coproporphyrinogen III oxidase [Sesbania bispinosa]|nr:oxygen-independent coproporphyrinogen III oxidase [Sesbania bispinosa]
MASGRATQWGSPKSMVVNIHSCFCVVTLCHGCCCHGYQWSKRVMGLYPYFPRKK